MSTTYAEFLTTKSQLGGEHGFEPLWLPDRMMPFQRHLSEWEIRKGRAATFAGCGLGKTLLALVRAENAVRKLNRRALILTHLAVAPQFVAEGEKFGVGVTHLRDGKPRRGAGVYVTNYDRLHLCDPADYGCVLCDESSGIKDAAGARTAAVTEFVRTVPLRGCYSATPAPNAYEELGTTAGALGELGYQDMLSKFFRQTTAKDHLGWGRTKYTLRGHAVEGFWRWVCSWARAVRRPSDLGFDDGPFVLPPLEVRGHVVTARTPRPGVLFDPGAVTVQEQAAERRRTVRERCEKVAELVSGTEPAVCWGHLNAETRLMTRLIPGAVEVAGSDREEVKEERLAAFAAGQIRVLVTKPTIAGWGLNWQHCAHMTFFPSHSFEQWHQCVHRCLRFGQPRPVVADVVTTEGEDRVVANLERKRLQAEAMFDRLTEYMRAGTRVGRVPYGSTPEEVPGWLSSTSA